MNRRDYREVTVTETKSGLLYTIEEGVNRRMKLVEKGVKIDIRNRFGLDQYGEGIWFFWEKTTNR